MKPTIIALSLSLLYTLTACAAPQKSQAPTQDTSARSTRYVSEEVKVEGLEGRHSASHSHSVLTYELVIQPDHRVVLDESELVEISYIICPDDMTHYPQHQSCTPRGSEGPPQRRRHTRYEGRAIFDGDALTRLELSPRKTDKDDTTGFVMPCKSTTQGHITCERSLPMRDKVDVNFRLVPRA